MSHQIGWQLCLGKCSGGQGVLCGSACWQSWFIPFPIAEKAVTVQVKVVVMVSGGKWESFYCGKNYLANSCIHTCVEFNVSPRSIFLGIKLAYLILYFILTTALLQVLDCLLLLLFSHKQVSKADAFHTQNMSIFLNQC